MKVHIYGTRGSYPVCKREFMYYGGNTTSVLLTHKDEMVLVDAGSGIVNFGREFLKRPPEKQRRLNLFLTHAHWDHIMGLPFFYPFYQDNFEINIYGSDFETMRLREVVERQWDGQSNFPVSFSQLSARIKFHTIGPGASVQLEHFKVSAIQLNHVGYCLGYRFESESGVFAIITDTAPIEGNALGRGMQEAMKDNPASFENDFYGGLVEFVRDAHLVMYDTNFTEAEIEGKRHWGHSTPDMALGVLSQLDYSPALLLSHHDADHSDEQMHAIYQETLRKGKRSSVDVFIAREGKEFRL